VEEVQLVPEVVPQQVKPRAEVRSQTSKKPAAAARPPERPASHKRHLAPPPPRENPWILGKIYGVVLVIAVLTLIATFFLVPRKEVASAYAPVFQQAGEVAVADPSPLEVADVVVEPAPEAVTVVETPPAARPKPAAKKPDFDPSLPLAVVGVPDVGLRAAHSLEAQVFTGKIKKGEKVAILKSYAPATGPTWIKIQTKSGKTGWVFASVLTDRKSKGK
jgi:hypothetical protein